jgi:hypothetical protein
MAIFTDAYLRNLKPMDRRFKEAEESERGAGNLVARMDPDGTLSLWYRYFTGNDPTRIWIGDFDSGGVRGVTLRQARRELRRLQKLRRDHGDVKRHLAALHRQKDLEARLGTLGDLCTG